MNKFLLSCLLFSLSWGAWAGDIKNGRRLVELNNCASCHGANLNQPIAAEYPKIAGQHRDYLFHSLLSYQIKDNARVGRNNGVMVGQMAKFTRQELDDMAAYIASLPGDLVIKR